MDQIGFIQIDSLLVPPQKFQVCGYEHESYNELEFLGQLSHTSFSDPYHQGLIPLQNSTVESPPVRLNKGPKTTKNQEERMIRGVKKNLVQFYAGKISQHFKQNQKINKEERSKIESLKKYPSLKKLDEIFQIKGVVQLELTNFFEKKNLSKITFSSRCRNQNTKSTLKKMGNQLKRKFIYIKQKDIEDIYIKQVLVISGI